MGSRSVTQSDLNKTPSDVAARADRVAQDLAVLRNWFQNHAEGIFLGAPTTPSAQAGGVGNTTWRIDHSIGFAMVNNAHGHIAASADFVVHSGSLLTGFIVGTSCVAAIVVYVSASGVLTHVAITGTPATTGAQLPPTDAAIQAAVNSASGVTGTAWVKVGETTLNRTGDAVVTQSYDNSKRPLPAVSNDVSFGNWS